MVKISKAARMHERIARHAANLDIIFPNATRHGVELAKTLRSLETKAARYTLALCNGGVDLDGADIALDKIEIKLRQILGVDDAYPVFINRDPRGYALKIQDTHVSAAKLVIYRDWGGYGILAPDFKEE